MYNEDPISSITGSFGLWQAGVFLLTAFVKVPSAWHMLGVLFKAPSVDFWCVQPKQLSYLPVDVWINLSHPIVTISNDVYHHNPCEIYDVQYENILQNQDYKGINVTDIAEKFSHSASRKHCEQFQYDNSLFHETVVMEWHLVCNRKILVNVSQFFYLFGVLVGGFIAMLLILRIGSRWLLLLGAAIQIIAGTATAYAPLMEINIALRFAAAFGCAFMFTAGYKISRDITWGRSRIITCAFYEIFWSIGVMSLPGMCLIFGTKSWRLLQIAISVPTTLLLVIAYFFLPESPRWLIENGRIEEAEKIIRRMAYINGRQIPINQPLHLKKETDAFPTNQNGKIIHTKKQPLMNCCSWMALFNGSGRRKMIPLHLLWGITIVTYYGALLNVKNLGRSLFLNTFIAGIAEIVGITIGTLIILYKGRRKWTLLGAIMITGGLICIASWFLLLDMDSIEEGHPISSTLRNQCLLVTLAMAGRVAIACSFTILQVSSAELFSSDQILIASLSTVTFARICLSAAPFIEILAVYGECVSLTAFGMLTIVGGIASLSISPTIGLTDCYPKCNTRNINIPREEREIWTVGQYIQKDMEDQGTKLAIYGYTNKSYISE